MPMATSLAWQRVFSEPMRWSPEHSRNDPPATAGPVAATTTGTGKRRTRSISSMPPRSMANPAAASPEPKIARSNPALKTRLLPAMTTALTSSACSA